MYINKDVYYTKTHGLPMLFTRGEDTRSASSRCQWHLYFSNDLKDKFGVDKIIVKKQPYELLNTSREFFPSFDASNCHELVNESS